MIFFSSSKLAFTSIYSGSKSLSSLSALLCLCPRVSAMLMRTTLFAPVLQVLAPDSALRLAGSPTTVLCPRQCGWASGTNNSAHPLPSHSGSRGGVRVLAPSLWRTELIPGLPGGAGLGSQLFTSFDPSLPRLWSSPGGWRGELSAPLSYLGGFTP